MKQLIVFGLALILLISLASAETEIARQDYENDGTGFYAGSEFRCQVINITSSIENPRFVFKTTTKGTADSGNCLVSIHNGTLTARDTFIVNSTETRLCADLDVSALWNWTFSTTLSSGYYWFCSAGNPSGGDHDNIDIRIAYQQAEDKYTGGELRYTNGSTVYSDYNDIYFFLYGTEPDTTPPVLSNFTITSNNSLSGESTTWNENITINITSNLLSFTFNTDEAANCSARLGTAQNYTEMVAANANYKLATTDTTDHSYTLYDNATDGNHSIYVSCIDALGNEPAAGVSSSGPLNITYDTCWCPVIAQNWQINMSKTCLLETACDLTGYNVSFIETGNFTLNQTLTCDNCLSGLNTGMTLFLKSSAVLNIGRT